MSLDFFDYTEFSDFNISNDSLLTYQDNLFYSFCIYEFHLDFLLYFFNIFNLSFFHKSTLKKAKLEDINKNKLCYNSYMTHIKTNDTLPHLLVISGVWIALAVVFAVLAGVLTEGV